MIAGTLYCCECNLCSLYSCPENLDPKNICTFSKPLARERELQWKGNPADVQPHPLADSRRAPMKRLIAKLGLADFTNVGPLEARVLEPRRVVLPLKQHAGAPAVPAVTVGDARVRGRPGRRAGTQGARRPAARQHHGHRADGRRGHRDRGVMTAGFTTRSRARGAGRSRRS